MKIWLGPALLKSADLPKVAQIWLEVLPYWDPSSQAPTVETLPLLIPWFRVLNQLRQTEPQAEDIE